MGALSNAFVGKLIDGAALHIRFTLHHLSDRCRSWIQYSTSKSPVIFGHPPISSLPPGEGERLCRMVAKRRLTSQAIQQRPRFKNEAQKRAPCQAPFLFVLVCLIYNRSAGFLCVRRCGVAQSFGIVIPRRRGGDGRCFGHAARISGLGDARGR